MKSSLRVSWAEQEQRYRLFTRWFALFEAAKNAMHRGVLPSVVAAALKAETGASSINEVETAEDATRAVEVIDALQPES